LPTYNFLPIGASKRENKAGDYSRSGVSLPETLHHMGQEKRSGRNRRTVREAQVRHEYTTGRA